MYVSPSDLEKSRGQIEAHARKHAKEDAEDLTESALVEALDHYNPEKGKFPTFAFLVYKRIFCTYWTKRNRVPRPVQYHRRLDIDNAEVARLYLLEKFSLAKIGLIMKCDPVTVMDRLESMGIDRRPRKMPMGETP